MTLILCSITNRVIPNSLFTFINRLIIPLIKAGFIPAVLIHWATNYFIFSYGYIVAEINQISIGDAFSHSLLNTLELMLVVTGIISVAVLVLNYVYSRKHTLEA